MKYAEQNVRLAALKNECDKFRKVMCGYFSDTIGGFDGLTVAEEKSVYYIFGLLAKLDDEFEKWDFDDSYTGKPFRNGKIAPVLKEYLK